MRQPLMLPTTGIPPAQAEALYDASLEDTFAGRQPADARPWPGEDWEEETQAQESFPPIRRLRTTGH